MALDDGLDALASKILDDTASYMTSAQKAASLAPMKKFLEDVMEHIADKAEVSTTLDAAAPTDLTVLVAGAPVPVLGASIGGAAAAATAAGTVA